MTENHSEFAQESGVDHSRDVGQKALKEDDSVLNDIQAEKTTNFNDTYKPEIEEDKKEIVCPDLSNIGCEEESNPLQYHWVKFSSFLKKFYRTILDGKKPPDEFECHVNMVRELVAIDPHQLFARLEMDLQEFIIEVKLRQLELLNCVHTEEGPHLFIFCLLEGYNKLMFAAYTLSPLLLQLEVEHLARFNISWRGLNQHLFHKLVFTEPKIQTVLPLCISKLGKTNSDLSDFNKRLIRQFLTFDDEMTKVGGRWREAESAIIKYHQENSMLDARWRMTKVNWDLIRSQTKAFHEELKSSGIPPCLDADLLYATLDGNISFDNNNDSGVKTSLKNTSLHIKTLTDSLKKMKIDLETLQDQQLCDCCHLNAAQCLTNPDSLSLESFLDLKVPKNCSDSSCEVPCKDADILAHLNADGKKMYSHLHRFKAHQSSSGGKTRSSTESAKDCRLQDDIPTDELYKTQVRKQMIQHQRQQHQKKLMQMMQSSQQKDIQHKIQKQLQEHQLFLQQQRKIDELHAHLLQQRPATANKETQKNVHLQVQHRLIQKHKQVEEKFQQQVQQYMQLHQDKQSNGSNSGSCNHTKHTIVGSKNNSKCSSSTPNGSSPNISSASIVGNSTTSSTAISNAKSRPASTSASSKVNASTTTHKNSTTQTNASPSAVNGEGLFLTSDGDSINYVCLRHSDGSVDQNSTDNSSDDEFDWDNSNSPQRHCDCCYCEVFGSAPVSRNFQETRERLRLILTKKKAKSNAANGGEKSTSEQHASNSASCTNSQAASQGVNKSGKESGANDNKYKPPEYKGEKSIQEILDFIEGNKRNMKRTAKKMRRKQRQLEEEERRRKEAEEAERLRQEELRRQEQEEKRKLEEEKRKQELARKQDRKKNKKQKQQQQQQASITKTPAQSNQAASKKNKNEKAVPQIISDNAKLAQTKKNGQKQVMDKNALQKQVAQQQQQAKTAKKKQEEAKQSQKNAKNQKSTQPLQNGNNSKTAAQTKTQKVDEKSEDDSGQPQMVTIKRVMQPNSNEPTVTITLRGPTPKEDKVLYTLQNGQINQIKEDKQKQPNVPLSNLNAANKKKLVKLTNGISNPAAYPHPNNSNYNGHNPHLPAATVTLSNAMNFAKSCNVTGIGVNNITDGMDKMKLGPQTVPIDTAKKFMSTPCAPQAELTTPTAIQINQAVSQLSSRPMFPNNFDLENIKLPPGITITKVDPATVQRKPIQVKQQPPIAPVPPSQMRLAMMPPQMSCSSNVIVVDTGDKNDDQGAYSKKKRRRRKNGSGEMSQDTESVVNAPAIPPYVPTNGLPSRLNPLGAGLYGNPFMNASFGGVAATQQQPPAAIIQMNGSMVTIRNPALHQAYSGVPPAQCAFEQQNVSIQPSNAEMWNPNTNDTVFSSSNEIENGDVDEYERELEAFKRFCSQSVPAESKAKVNLNIEDIVLKKKGPVIGCS